MAADAATPRAAPLGSWSPSHLGLVGQVATSWGVAGGLVASLVVTAHVLLGRLSSSLGFLTTTLFFLVGAIIGYLHGALLGYLGRPPEVGRRTALHRLAVAALYALPSIVAGWLVAMVVALSAASILAGRVAALAASLVGWLAALVVLWWALRETRGAVVNLFRRWPDARALLMALGLAFLVLLPVFMLLRPEIWIVGVKPSATAACAMAMGATLWILGPLGALGLLALRAWSEHHPSSTPPEVPHGLE